MELVYEDFVMRLDGPMIEVVGRIFKGIFRHHVNSCGASSFPSPRNPCSSTSSPGPNAGGPRRGRPALGSRRGSARSTSG
jgi:hypothetical protein